MSGYSETLWNALTAGSLLPSGHGLSASAIPDEPGWDLLPLLMRAWDTAQSGATGTAGRRAKRQADRFRDWHAKGSRLTVGIPGSIPGIASGWLGLRLAWWPQGIPPGRRVGLVSSRLGQAPDTQEAWFTALRAACTKINPQRDLLLTAASTTTARYVERCAVLFGLRVLRTDVPKQETVTLEKWLARAETLRRDNRDTRAEEVFLSPPLGEYVVEDEAVRHTPARDRALVALSERLLVFRVRRDGHVHHLVRARLLDPAWPVASVYVAIGPKLVRTEMADELMDLGAVGWVVLDAVEGSTDEVARSPGASPVGDCGRASSSPAFRHTRGGDHFPQTSAIVSLPSAENWPYLTHSTRRREGPWPDQEGTDYLDDLILARQDADHSALAALKRIVKRKRLIATAETIRGGTPVVSLTAVPLAELHRLRVFRPHRGRWDFEPYGICIHRDWLQSIGTRPVQYGNDELWESLPPDERPFFQLRRTRRSVQADPIDWAVEDEWRVIGDIDLSKLPADAALLFVSNEAHAQEMAAISRWPVTVVPG
jgi:hypothetical protein